MKHSSLFSKRIFLTITAAAVVSILMVGAGVYFYLTKSNPEGKEIRINFRKGTNLEQARQILFDRLDHEYAARVVELLDYMLDDDQAGVHGSYLVQPGQSAVSLARAIRYGRETPFEFTFNNVRLLSDLASKVGQSFEADSASFMQACTKVLTEKGFKHEEFPAAFLPDSYQMKWGVSAEEIVKRLLEYRESFWNAERKAKAKALGLSPAQVATVASIVEEESAKTDEHPVIARLYLNRIDADMPLQADPTLKFAAGDFTIKRLYAKHKEVESPYNTYRHKGLPPGPIRIAEGRAIDAVLNAPKNNYLYMCASVDRPGFHEFTESFDRHKANAARYQAKLNKDSIF